jgi:protein transport protein SEC24
MAHEKSNGVGVDASVAALSTLLMPDKMAPYVPTQASRLFFNDGPTVVRLLDKLLAQYATNTTTHSVLGTAVTLAGELLEESGGQIILFQHGLPNDGLGAVPPRTDASSSSSSSSSSALNPLEPQSLFYKELGENFATKGIAVDLFYMPQQLAGDLATVGLLSALSGGKLHPFFAFQETRDGPLVTQTLAWHLESYRALDAVLRVRFGNGLSLVDHYGTFYARNATDWAFGKFDASTTLSLSYQHDTAVKLAPGTEIPIQVAVLYTDVRTAVRKIRLLHMAVRVAAPATPTTVFKASDLDAIIYVMAQATMASMAPAPPPSDPRILLPLRQMLFAKTVRILAGYRRTCAATSSPGQLILPDNLKLLPIYLLGLTKSKLFRDVTSALPMDRKIAILRIARSLDLATLVTHFYPKLFHLTAGSEDASDLDNNLPPYRALPVMSLSQAHLDSTQAYVMDTGLNLILWLGHHLSSNILMALFDVPTLDRISTLLPTPPILATSLSKRFHTLRDALQQKHQRPLPVLILRQHLDAPIEQPEFIHALVHDKSPLGTDYIDLLCLLHTQIQAHLADN